ncbi:MAG: hypothetical protein M5U01_07395 [Ardenticatenaceae bacterium]|nr:hypothetical protein [Ardenticatenaceae bacterium]HBY99484.1 hypothetical protein [Chloroflexota bacterium]
MCVQSVGLIARGLELNGIATTLTTWNPGIARLVAPPRATFTRLARGATIGRPHDTAQQRRVLEATLALLYQDAPLAPVYLDESNE